MSVSCSLSAYKMLENWVNQKQTGIIGHDLKFLIDQVLKAESSWSHGLGFVNDSG